MSNPKVLKHLQAEKKMCERELEGLRISYNSKKRQIEYKLKNLEEIIQEECGTVVEP